MKRKRSRIDRIILRSAEMIELTGKNGIYLINGQTVVECPEDSSTDVLQQQLASSGVSTTDLNKEKARTNTNSLSDFTGA